MANVALIEFGLLQNSSWLFVSCVKIRTAQSFVDAWLRLFCWALRWAVLMGDRNTVMAHGRLQIIDIFEKHFRTGY